MYKKMVVPLDGSELAETALPYVRELTRRLALETILLNVCPTQQKEFAAVHRAYVDKVVTKVKGQMGVKGHSRTPSEGKVRGRVLVGEPAERILRYASDNGIDLILMATHGESGTRRWAMGSVVDRVLRAAKVPVLVVRTGIREEIVYDQWPRRSMLVPLDGSPLAEAAVPHAEQLARQRSVELVDVVLISVCEPRLAPSFYPFHSPLEGDEDLVKRRLESENYLSAIAARLKGAGIGTRTLVLEGKPADQIIDYANSNQFNMIVMTTHGSSGTGRWTYGSVAEKVLLGASSPILLVHPG
jgi:nucleotide-binding universal stress UspA family protein